MSSNWGCNYCGVSLWELVWAVSIAVVGGAIWRSWIISAARGNPTNWPVVGMLPALLLNVHCFYDYMTTVLIANGGSFQFYGPWFTSMHYFSTSDPRNVEYALRDHFQNFPKGRDFSAIFHDLLGEGIFNSDHELWRMQRKSASLHLNSRMCRQFADDTVFAMVETKLLPILQDVCHRRVQIDLQDLMLRFTFDAVCSVGFGVDTGCLSPGLPVVPFAKAFETALETITLRFFLPSSWWQALRWLHLGKEREMPEAIKIVDEFAEEVIAARKKELQIQEGGCMKADLLSCFMKMGVSHSDRFLKDVVVNFLLAGRDTSALALSWFFWLLAKHPEVEEKVAREVRHVVAAAAAAKEEEGKPLLTRTELNQMPYLHAALSEALRLYPSVPVEVKHVTMDDVFPDGSHVKKDHKFIYSIYTMGRMESIWGLDCTTFRPERWLQENGITPALSSCMSPFQYTVFNAGPRTCLGKDMAFLLMKSVASTLLFHFRVVLVPGHKVVPKLCITLYMKDGLLVSLQPRESLSS